MSDPGLGPDGIIGNVMRLFSPGPDARIPDVRTATVDPNGSAALPLAAEPAPLSNLPLSNREAATSASDMTKTDVRHDGRQRARLTDVLVEQVDCILSPT